MDRRINLQEELVDLAGSSYRVYFQPPEGTQIEYPCVVYGRSGTDSKYANNHAYRFTQQYQITVITREADCSLPKKILEHFPMCRIDRSFTTDNMYHHVLTLFY